jgi:hypothetical protein
MKQVRRLDAGHITRASAYAVRERARQDGVIAATVRIDAADSFVRIRIAETEQRTAAIEVLRQLGYGIARQDIGRPIDEVTVSGWAFARLAERAVHLDEAAEALTGGWRATAATAIDVYRQACGDVRSSVAVRARAYAIGSAISSLTRRLLAESGPHVPHDPSVRPADARIAHLLAAVWRLEERVDELLALHRTVAFDAVTRYAGHATRLTRRQAFRRAANEAAQAAGHRVAEAEPVRQAIGDRRVQGR